MTAVIAADQLTAAGLRWDGGTGQAGLSGPLLALADRLDQAFGIIAAMWQAEPEQHPATLPAALLDELGYLRGFPHQATFAVALDGDEANVDEFLAGPVLDVDRVALTRLAPVTTALTPAACYHVYAARRGQLFDTARYFTVKNTCFRRESHYRPLRRQSNFTMREVVCVATPAETVDFLESARSVTQRFADAIDLSLDWCEATDPFFRPDTNPRHLAQRIIPSKLEATYGDLAIGSANRHYEHFGELMGISCAGAPAHSACLAFGVERWLYAITDRHGVDALAWPDPLAAARKATAWEQH